MNFFTAMVEYSLDIKIPEHVWDHPILIGLSRAAIDIMTWPNVRALHIVLKMQMLIRCLLGFVFI